LARKLLLVGVLLVAAAAAVVILITRAERTPSAGESPVPARKVNEIVVTYPEEPATFNPYLYEGDSNATRDLLRPALPTLLSINDRMQYVPGLATSVPAGSDIKSNPFSVTFHLDPKAKWSDDVDITSADVKFTWELITNSSLPIADRSAYRRIVELRTPDPRTLTLVFDKPYPAWRDLFSAGDFILPKHALEGKDFETVLNDGLPVSGGPFLLESFTRGLEVVYKANPKWWGSGPSAERVRVWFVPDIETAIQLLTAKRAGVVTSTSQVGLKRRLENVEGVKVLSRFGSAWWELGFNQDADGSREGGFREAAALSFDRAGFAEALLKEDGRVLQTLRPGSKDAFAKWTPGSDKAQKLLSGSGFTRGADRTFSKGGTGRFSISAPAENEIVGLLEKSLQTGFRRSGIAIEPMNPRGQVFYSSTRRRGDFNLALWERRGTPSLALSSYYSSVKIPPAGLNYSRSKSQELDAALAASETSASFKQAALDQVMTLLADSLPAVPLFEVKAYIGYRDDLTGFKPNASVDGPFWNIAEWGAAA
jgi:peptide/nickel transport system substrate-binding protein